MSLEVPMFKTFETLAAAEASGPFAIYWHGDSEGYCSGSFLEISNFIPAEATFSLIGVHTIWGMVMNFDDKPSMIFEAPISAKDAWSQITDELEVAEMDRHDEANIESMLDCLMGDRSEGEDSPEYFGA
jgi:hypothetical protein